MIRHFVVRVGDWMFANWHLYRWHEVRNAKYVWHDWTCVFCGRRAP